MRLHTRLTEFIVNYLSSSHNWLNSNWTSRVVLTHDWLNSNWIECRLYIRLNSKWTAIACSVLPFNPWKIMFLPSRNLYKCKQAAGIIVIACFYPVFLYCTFLLVVYFLTSFYFFILILLLYFCLLINHVNKPIIFVFRAFVHHFKNTISIFLTIFKPLTLNTYIF